MRDAAKKFYYFILTIIFYTISICSSRLYLKMFRDHKSHPYILAGIYFIFDLFFIIIFYLNLPKKKKNDLLESNNIFRKRVNSIKLYKRNSIITLEEHKKQIKRKKKFANICQEVYCVKNEVIHPSILFSISQGINIYTLGKIDVTLFLMINGSILISFFRILKSKGISKIKPNRVISALIEVLSILVFIIYHLFFSELEISYLFFILLTFFASVIFCFAKYYNYKTIHRYNIDFISDNIKIGKDENKEEILIENQDDITESTDNNINGEIINSLNEHEDKDDFISTGSSSNLDDDDNNDEDDNFDEKIKDKNFKHNNLYFSYEKIIFYEGALCFSFWAILVFIFSFIKCPEDNLSSFKLFVCNNCTTITGYETFFNSKEMVIFNNVQYKNKLIKYIYNYPLCTIIFIIIMILSEFFYHYSFEKLFQGKYKTKLVLFLNPIVSLIIFGAQYLGKYYSGNDSFLDKILPKKINFSELILCLCLFIGSTVSYLRIFEFKCKK